MHRNPFSDAELDRRLAATRQQIQTRGLDAAIFAAPESVFYLTGLDHWGYFAPHLLLVPLDRRPVLVTRAMERVSIETMARSADFRGHSDSETAADEMTRVLGDLGLGSARLGLEMWSAGLSHGLGQALMDAVGATWTDVSGLSDALRLVKSAEEQALVRAAAKATNAGTQAAIDALHDGAAEQDAAAECLAAMTRAGGEPPGFGPFLRPGARLGEEHTTWGHGAHGQGPVFLEISGCVGRYHAPNGRLVHIGPVSDQDAEIASVVIDAFQAVLKALRPGALASDVYGAWQGVVDHAGLAHYRRHHCGYSIGIGIPPSWTGGNSVTGLRHHSPIEIKEGMVFHVLSWLMGSGRGDFFLSDCVLLGPDGPEVLTTTPHGPTQR
ncbi:MAG: Xaa-Pro peptidase family protein [Pseudomonadota bacterium]